MDNHNDVKIDCNPGIRCDVSNCIYNDKHKNCYADKITVGPTHANNEKDTLCSTFKQENS